MEPAATSCCRTVVARNRLEHVESGEPSSINTRRIPPAESSPEDATAGRKKRLPPSPGSRGEPSETLAETQETTSTSRRRRPRERLGSGRAEPEPEEAEQPPP